MLTVQQCHCLTALLHGWKCPITLHVKIIQNRDIEIVYNGTFAWLLVQQWIIAMNECALAHGLLDI